MERLKVPEVFREAVSNFRPDLLYFLDQPKRLEKDQRAVNLLMYRGLRLMLPEGYDERQFWTVRRLRHNLRVKAKIWKRRKWPESFFESSARLLGDGLATYDVLENRKGSQITHIQSIGSRFRIRAGDENMIKIYEYLILLGKQADVDYSELGAHQKLAEILKDRIRRNS